MNPSGPIERVTVARYDDDYPLAVTEADADRDAGRPAGAYDDASVRVAVVRPETAPIQVDLLDAWFKP